MPEPEIPFLDEEGLAEVLARAQAERWTELAVLGPEGHWRAQDFVSSGWPPERVIRVKVPYMRAREDLARLTDLTSLNLAGMEIGDAGAELVAHLENLISLDLSDTRISLRGLAALARLTGLKSLSLKGNFVDDAGAEVLARHTGLTSLDLAGNEIDDAGVRAVLDAWSEPATANRRRALDLRGNPGIEGLLPEDVIASTDAQKIIAAWRDRRGEEIGSAPLPPPEAAGTQDARGAAVGTSPDGRLVLVDPALAEGARDDAIGRELHGELVAALDRLIVAAARSNALAAWREAANEVKERLGSNPRAVRVTVIPRIEYLRALREADERRRSEPDPLTDPAEAGAAATMRAAVAAANLYVETDPWLAEQQRRLADPTVTPVLELGGAAELERDLEEAKIADEALRDELRAARETAEIGGEAGRRAHRWLDGSWRNVFVEATRQTLAALRDLARSARAQTSEGIERDQKGTPITVDETAAALEATGLKGRLASIRSTAAPIAGRIGRRVEVAYADKLGTAFATGTLEHFPISDDHIRQRQSSWCTRWA